ncbi:LLM class flavin-dependent oxidoreductase [Auraticoccus sp. F435]|uniref:LLM class flavin-dependent oxidoreductase n=1 Tax=Auraticoccus cholistanensis TaxID=2656650 RepID=A0A6A9URA0_9ACTN|nr:LLM class flavin-dependent oxidoreductase [Auraticoccus cholistanensis]
MHVPNIGPDDGSTSGFADPRLVAELAHEAEECGWDGFFVWDHIGAGWPVAVADPWILLTAVALRTSVIRLGALVTPLPRRRPWKVARETATLDQLCDGRLVFGAGIGGGPEYSSFDEPGDDREHGDMLDEALQVLTGLWSGEPFDFEGHHYRIHDVQFLPRPVQQRIPVWVAGTWPSRRPLRRASRWDGVFPLGRGLGFDQQMSPEDLAAVVELVRHHRSGLGTPYDVVHWGISTGTDLPADRELVARYEAAGATWWLENLNNQRGSVASQRERIRRGPPR